jgi:DNA-binding MarR family transcriptional regulator
VSAFKYKTPGASTGFLLWQLSSLWQQMLAAELCRFDINQTQFAILASLKWFSENARTVTQTVLAEHVKIEKMTLSKSIRQLENMGLVTRLKSSEDGRSVTVDLSSAGKKIINKAIVTVENADDAFFSELKPAKIRDFQALMQSLIDSS